MIPLTLTGGTRPLEVLAIGAHPDDIEIGAGGLLLTLSSTAGGAHVRYVVLTGTAERHAEARHAAECFLKDAAGMKDAAGAADPTVDAHELPEGRLPAAWAAVKEILEAVARSRRAPDLILAPSRTDAHQDHRTIAEIVPTVFRDQLCLGYEIPKWDGDPGQPAVYLPLPEAVARRKVVLLHECFPSQRRRDWWDDEVFLGLARLRGMECRSRFAEAFHCTKAVLNVTS